MTTQENNEAVMEEVNKQMEEDTKKIETMEHVADATAKEEEALLHAESNAQDDQTARDEAARGRVDWQGENHTKRVASSLSSFISLIRPVTRLGIDGEQLLKTHVCLTKNSAIVGNMTSTVVVETPSVFAPLFEDESPIVFKINDLEALIKLFGKKVDTGTFKRNKNKDKAVFMVDKNKVKMQISSFHQDLVNERLNMLNLDNGNDLFAFQLSTSIINKILEVSELGVSDSARMELQNGREFGFVAVKKNGDYLDLYSSNGVSVWNKSISYSSSFPENKFVIFNKDTLHWMSSLSKDEVIDSKIQVQIAYEAGKQKITKIFSSMRSITCLLAYDVDSLVKACESNINKYTNPEELGNGIAIEINDDIRPNILRSIQASGLAEVTKPYNCGFSLVDNGENAIGIQNINLEGRFAPSFSFFDATVISKTSGIAKSYNIVSPILIKIMKIATSIHICKDIAVIVGKADGEFNNLIVTYIC